MTPRRRTLVLAFCLLLLLCVQGAKAITVRITEADGARVQVSLDSGDLLRVDLPAEPAAGLQWGLAGHPPLQLETLAATQRVFGGRLSNQGTSSFAWKAIAAGEADLTLGYGTPSSRTVHPQRTVQLHVTVAGEAPARASSAPKDSLPEVPEMEQVGAYMRTGPCADCSALVERLSLYHAAQRSTFLLRRTYRDAPGGTLTVISTGAWSASKGTADPAAIIYQLVGNDVAYLVRAEKDRLVPLDPQQIPLPAPAGADGDFHKVPDQ